MPPWVICKGVVAAAGVRKMLLQGKLNVYACNLYNLRHGTDIRYMYQHRQCCVSVLHAAQLMRAAVARWHTWMHHAQHEAMQ